MSSDKIGVALQEREIIRKGLAKIRDEGMVPAVVHDHGKPSLHVMGDYMKLNKTFSRAGKHHPVQLTIGNKRRLALIKDVDFEPKKHKMRHVVFQAIRQNEKTTAEIPVVLTGDEIPAEKEGLMVLKQLDNVQVEALPMDLPDQLEADATVLAEEGDKLTVADIKVPAGVTILVEPEHSLAVVEVPRDQVAEANAAAEELAKDKEAGEPAEKEAAETEEKEETESEASAGEKPKEASEEE